MQFQCVGGNPGDCSAHTEAGAVGDACKAVPVHRAMAQVVADRQCGFAPAGTGAVCRGVDGHPCPGIVGSEMLGHDQRAAFSGRRDQGAAHFLLHHVVGAKSIAHVPAHDLFASAPLPGAKVVVDFGLVQPRLSIAIQPGCLPRQGLLLRSADETPVRSRCAKLGLQRRAIRLNGCNAALQSVGLRQWA